jgi:hypothetical protein
MRTGLGALLRFCRLSTVSLLVVLRAAPVALIIFALLLPAYAQYWGDPWSGRQQQRQQQYNPFGSFWGDRSGGFWGQREAPRYPRQRERAREAEREQPPDYSRAPVATPRKDAAVKIVVMGDANADWLAYGLEDAYSEKPEIGIVRKHRTDSGLVSYDARRDTEWPQVAREIAERNNRARHGCPALPTIAESDFRYRQAMSHYLALKSGRRIYSEPVLTVLVSIWKVQSVPSRGTGPRHPT